MENDKIQDFILSEDGKTLISCKNISVTNISIPYGVETIGEEAFCGCTSLQSIDIPDSVTTIGEGAFRGCKSLQSIDIPDSVTTIGREAFFECKSLQSIDIPDSVTTIGIGAFSECTSLQSIDVAVTNPKFTSFDGILFNKEKSTIIRMPEGIGITEYTISDSVTTIGIGAFSGCKSLQSIDILDSVTTIESGAFSRCESLQSIRMHHKDIKACSIGDRAFDEINFDECILYIPSGTRWAYRHHSIFGKFKNIETEKREK